jgi:hypothetical protein
VLLRQTDEGGRERVEGDEGFERGADLAAAAVDLDEVGK